MSMKEWAEREIKIACANERKHSGTPEGDWDYGCACYESALKAFNSLLEDEHSGASWSFTRSILRRLMNHQPLTPIEDTDDVWSAGCKYEGDDYTSYQCLRMSSLFKDVYDDGTVEYTDVNRNYCVDIDSMDISFTTGLCRDIIDEMFPITMPYMPPLEPYKVVCETLLTDSKNGDFDIRAVLYIVDPENNRIDVNRYFDGRGEGWREIDWEEWCELKQLALNRED